VFDLYNIVFWYLWSYTQWGWITWRLCCL